MTTPHPTPQPSTFPPALERSGDFSKSFDPGGGLHTIFDPQTGAPFARNIIPASRITAVGQAIANTYPDPATAPALLWRQRYQSGVFHQGARGSIYRQAG